jgi:ATP-dependent RNA helicase DeaD
MPFPDAHPALARALADHGYTEPTPVQAAILEAGASGGDLLVSAQTGSGKTVAYGLAMSATLLEGAERLGPPGAPLALVVAPTRELALQVHRELAWLYGEAGGQVVSCVGGTDARREQRALASGAHIVVGTPGRLGDHLRRGQLDMSALRVVVLDEADEMLDLGFREELEALLDVTPAERRTLLFSATIAPEIVSLARRYQRDAKRLDMRDGREPHQDIEYRLMQVAPGETEAALVNVLRQVNSPAALVFCATREAVRRLHAALADRGFSAVALSGELSQAERTEALNSLRRGRSRVCVATDVAARGLDLPDLGLVVHSDLPADREALLHRSGRTGRAGRKGLSVLLVPGSKRRRAEQLLQAARIAVEWSAPPGLDAIRDQDQAALMENAALRDEAGEAEQARARALLAAYSPEAVAVAAVRLYTASLPAAERLTEMAPITAGPRPPRLENSNVVWFRAAVGRRESADPKWLLPLICRMGAVTRNEIGAIRVFEHDTRFEVARAAAERFAEAVSAAEGSELQITPAEDGGQAVSARPAGRPKRPPFRREGAAPRPERARRPTRA